MPKTNCNIIKDLLPSYIDELCSTESKTLIEEHFEECMECKKLHEKITLEMLYSKQAKSNAEKNHENKEIDYFKTIRINVNKKNKTLLLITAVLFLIQLYINFNRYQFGHLTITRYTNYIFPILIAGGLFVVFPDFAKHTISNKIKLPILGVEFGAMTYIFALVTFVAYSFFNNISPFGLKLGDSGPFLSLQILAVAVGFIIAFVTTLIISLRKKTICPALCLFPLVGLSLMLEYEAVLHELTSRFTISLFIRPYVIFICEIIVLVGIYMFVNRKKHL